MPWVNHRRVCIARTCAVLLLALVLAGALVTGTVKYSLLNAFPPYLHLDKLGHVIGFSGMAFALMRSRFSRIRPWHVLVLALMLGALTEFCQLFIPGRAGRIADVFIDVAAAWAGVAWQSAIARRSPRAEELDQRDQGIR